MQRIRDDNGRKNKALLRWKKGEVVIIMYMFVCVMYKLQVIEQSMSN